MTNRRSWLKAAVVGAASIGPVRATPADERTVWLNQLQRLASPVLENLAQGKLKATMPVEAAQGQEADRRKYTHLEAFGRLLAGIAPWLVTDLAPGVERDLQQRFAELARAGIAMATDPASPDCMNFSEGKQPVVDCGFLALAILRAQGALWAKLDGRTQRQLAKALAASRAIVPYDSNWLLFSATVEAALGVMGERWLAEPIEHAVRSHMNWYKGDGVYGDGPQFHWDYYNSYVIQPMLIDTLRAMDGRTDQWKKDLPLVMERARRYAAIQERLIAPDGSYPAVGRSIAYRCGAFHLLAQMALLGELPMPLSGAQVRCALGAVMKRTLDAPGTFDNAGWLTIGLCGHQPHLGETYISTGSLYLCSTVLLPLGLSPSVVFWAGAAEEWTARKLWSGQDGAADHAL
jgi:hypothetical protein